MGNGDLEFAVEFAVGYSVIRTRACAKWMVGEGESLGEGTLTLLTSATRAGCAVAYENVRLTSQVRTTFAKRR